MVRLPAAVAATILAHLAAAAPEEGCGLLARDASGTVCHAYCLANVARSPVRFVVDPDGHYAAVADAESRGWSIAGDFHSHPRSAAVPSRTDVAEALDPEWLHLIVGPGDGMPEMRAWWIRGGSAIEEAVVVEAGST
jgi:proteasome lid subunit RPN8/RPN11